MTDDEVDAFLTEQRNATVGTLGPQGRIHLVGMWYAWFDGHVWLETKPKSQKVVNLRRDPRMSFLVEAGHTYDQLRGVALEGDGCRRRRRRPARAGVPPGLRALPGALHRGPAARSST